MESNKLVIEIIKNRKEVFYPLFTIFVGFFVYWVLSIFINYANSLVVMLFLLWSLAILIFRYTLDMHNDNIKTEKPTSKKLIIFLFLLSSIIFIIVISGLTIMIIVDIYYFIQISINIFIAFLIYYALKKEVKNYYTIKNTRINE
ncbi:MAG: hypothetical protein ACFFA0_04960 [Promethearchaeota archaeon]